MKAPSTINFAIIRNGTWGELQGPACFETPITGQKAILRKTIGDAFVDCSLSSDGILWAQAGTQWDFASGPAISTPTVLLASLAHDMGCHLTDQGHIPWSCREAFDALYRDLLGYYGVGWARRWAHWSAVRTYSKTVAYWKRKEHTP